MPPTLTPPLKTRTETPGNASMGADPGAAPASSRSRERATIAQVVLTLEVGGGEMLAARLAERLDRNRFRSVVFCLRGSGWLARDLESRAVRVVVFDAGEGINPSLVRQLRAALRRERVDVVQCHNNMPLLYGGIAAVTSRRPRLLLTKHGQNLWRGWRQVALARFLLRRATVAAVSDDIRSIMVDGRWSPARQVRTIVNGIELERYRPGQGRGEVRREFGWPDDRFVAGIVARLSPEKDHSTLLRAFARAPEGAQLAIIGDGPLRAELEAQVGAPGLGGRCRFPGERSDVPRLLPALDAFVLSSTSEGTPLTLLEAMAAGLPTVTTRVGGMPAAIQEGETGLLVPPADSGAMAEALARLARDPALRRRMGDAGRRRAEEAYNVERMVRDYEQLYEEMMARR